MGAPWTKEELLIAKPDQMIKRRGKLGLIKIKTDLDQARRIDILFTKSESIIKIKTRFLG